MILGPPRSATTGFAHASPQRYLLGLTIEPHVTGLLAHAPDSAGGGSTTDSATDSATEADAGADGGGAFGTLSGFGLAVRHYWYQLPQRYLHVRLEPFAIGPRGVLGIVRFFSSSQAALDDPEHLRVIIRWLKFTTTKAYLRGTEYHGWARPPAGRVWRRGFDRWLLPTDRDRTAALERIHRTGTVLSGS
ncbi:MAG: hypothetical protein O2894_00470 [Planctomycetota bacterium]|nr:hypothetical protein [Planctomycetota bacterium]